MMVGLKIVVRGLNVELTSVYWFACPSLCRHAARLQSLTDVDKFYVVTSLPFDGTGRHIIQHVLIVAAHNGTSVRLELPPSAANHEPRGVLMPGRRTVHLDAFQSLAVESRESDLTGLSVEATKPIFLSVSVSSRLKTSSISMIKPIKTDSMPSLSNSSVQNQLIIFKSYHRTTQTNTTHSSPELNGSVQNEHILHHNPLPAATSPSANERNQYRTSQSLDVGAISASRDMIISGQSEAVRLDVAVVQMGSVGRLGMTYVLMFTDDRRLSYRIVGTCSQHTRHTMRYN